MSRQTKGLQMAKMPELVIKRWGVPVATVIGDGTSCTVRNLGRFVLNLRAWYRLRKGEENIELGKGETYVWPGKTVYVRVKR